MNSRVRFVQEPPGGPPHVRLTKDGVSLSIPWAEWQDIVHVASHFYLLWRAANGADLVDEGDGLERAGQTPPLAGDRRTR